MKDNNKIAQIFFIFFVLGQVSVHGYPEALIDEEKYYSQAQCLEHKLRGNVFKRTIEYPEVTVIELYDNLGRCRQVSYENKGKSIKFTDTFVYQGNQVISKREEGVGNISVQFNKLMQLIEVNDDFATELVNIKKNYDKNDNLASETLAFQNSNLNIVRIFGYRGMLIRIVTKDNEGKELTRKIIKYNAKEQPELIEVQGERRQKFYNIITEFDENGLPVLSNRIGKDEDGNKKVLRTVKTNRDQFGNPKSIAITENESENFLIKITYEYW